MQAYSVTGGVSPACQRSVSRYLFRKNFKADEIDRKIEKTPVTESLLLLPNRETYDTNLHLLSLLSRHLSS